MVGGEKKQLPWKEARAAAMMGSDYTRKTQSLAEERRAFEAERQQIQAEREQYQSQLSSIQGILKDPGKLGILIAAQQAAAAKQQQEPQALTSAHLPHLQQTLLQSVEQRVQAALERAHQAQAQAALETQLDEYTTELVKDHPILSTIEGLNDVIFAKVEKSLGYTTPPKDAAEQARRTAEAKQHIQIVVDNYRRAVDEKSEAQSKASATAKAKVLKGIEPKGGSPVTPQRRSIKKLEELDDEMNAFDWTGGLGG